MKNMSIVDIFLKHSHIDEITSMKKILYINTLGSNLVFIKKLESWIEKQDFSLSFSEFAEQFPTLLVNIFQEHMFDEIWTIHGPWPFTRMRIVSLAINSIKFSYPQIALRSISFEKLFSQKNIIPILDANNREYWTYQNWEEKFFEKNSLPHGDYCWFLTPSSIGVIDICRPSTFIEYSDSWDFIENIFSHEPSIPYIQPTYIKPPHITNARK